MNHVLKTALIAVVAIAVVRRVQPVLGVALV
jgi:hypothetical protein